MSNEQKEPHGFGAVVTGNIPADHLPSEREEWQLRGWKDENGVTPKWLYFGCQHPDKPNRADFPFCNVPIKPPQPNGWDFDGNLEAPTIRPSVNCLTTGCGFHQCFRSGRWGPC